VSKAPDGRSRIRDEGDRAAGDTVGALDQGARRAARSGCTILITGETGVGKGYLAKQVHEASPRGGGPFVPVNCGAIPESIIDSQLFGHVKGAFTGAISDHLGFVRAAKHGTLFLDEVGGLPPPAQTRLLRLLQDREVQPVGHPRPIVVEVRIVAATNSDLRVAVRERRFREDLLFRLDVVRLHLKPLRDRTGDVDTLTDLFNGEFAELYQQPRLVIEADARERLRRYGWPGNIRQLRTIVERLHVLFPCEPVTVERLAEVGHPVDEPGAGSSWGAVRGARHDELVRVLDENGGSVARAALIFGVHRSTIYRWLSRQAVDPTPGPR